MRPPPVALFEEAIQSAVQDDPNYRARRAAPWGTRSTTVSLR